jgi:hypothetical protein
VVDFVGMDPESPAEECAAVFRDPTTGDFYQQGRIVTDPALLERIGSHSPRADDEAVVWQPARMAPILAEAASVSYDRGRQGRGYPTFKELLAATTRSAVHLEMRDSYDEADPGFIAWKASGSASYDWGEWPEIVGAAVARGVRFRRVRVVSEPITDYIRWEHALTEANIRAGEEVRWLSRKQAYDLMLPGADLWMFDQRLVRFHFNAGDGQSLKQYEFVSDPRRVAQVVAAFEMIWERAIPHGDYRP